jgi:hypothetical protein
MECRGSWSLTAKDISYNGNILKCKLRTKKGKWLKNEITFFPQYEYHNIDGRFEWDNCKNGVNFKSISHENIRKRYKEVTIQRCLDNLTNEYDDWFEIESSHIQCNRSKCISISLFRKHSLNTYDNQYNVEKDLWDTKYLNNLKKNLDSYNQNDKCVNLYLANDLSYLLDTFRKYNFLNIYIMKSSSIGAQPGMLWRFIELTNKSYEQVIVADIDESWDWCKNIRYTNKLGTLNPFKHTDGAYRGDVEINNYRNALNFATILGSHIVSNPSKFNYDIKNVIKGFIKLCYIRISSSNPYGFDDNDPITYWNNPVECHIYGWGKIPTMYGFDEFFLKHVMYYDCYPDIKFM